MSLECLIIGEEGVKELESKLKKFQSWSNKKQAEKMEENEYKCSSGESKIKNVPMTSDKYISNVKRVLNTHHM